jgi:hypothetical protein
VTLNMLSNLMVREMKEKKIFLSLIAICLMIGAQSVYVKSEYQLGFDRGVFDAKSCFPWSVLTPTGNIFDKHPQTFWDGWFAGFCSIGPMASDEDRLTFDCSYESSYKSGFSHGVADATLEKKCCVYV